MKAKTLNKNVGTTSETAVHLAEEVLWFSGGPASWIYLVCDKESRAWDDIEVVRPRARGLLERFRVRLLLQALSSRTAFDSQDMRLAMPHETGVAFHFPAL